MDMMRPVREQMRLVKQYGLPATWLLQFDALVSGPFVPFLKANMESDHEVGFWFEMNEKHCRAAGVEWRGRPGYEWDFTPSVAFTIGYTIEERKKLADAAMQEFKRIWGHFPRSVASWNLDAVTMEYLISRYGVEAFAVCRDQVATDGFTIWGAPIAGYYPSDVNCWGAEGPGKGLSAPVFRMLGQDPVYYYARRFRMPDGRLNSAPDTMEPVWPSGQNATFVERFLAMIESGPSVGFAYAQLGQENTFPWEQQEPGYEPQMKALAEVKQRGVVHVETMGETGRRFRRAFKSTPAQAQVMVRDPFGNEDQGERSAWYQSRYYRANLHFRGQEVFFRDITVYPAGFEQPFLRKPTRLHDVEQRMPAVLDGYHWSSEGFTAGGFFEPAQAVARAATKMASERVLSVHSRGSGLQVETPYGPVVFSERGLSVRQLSKERRIHFKVPRLPNLSVGVSRQLVSYETPEVIYSVAIRAGAAKLEDDGWSVGPEHGVIDLGLAQPG